METGVGVSGGGVGWQETMETGVGVSGGGVGWVVLMDPDCNETCHTR